MLITDRTEADVLLAETLIAQGKTSPEYLKGSYTAVYDMNRVEREMERVASIFKAYGYSFPALTTKVWTASDIVTEADIDRYLLDLKTLASLIHLFDSTPVLPKKSDWLTYIAANDIEKILVDIDQLITNMAAAWFYAGDLFSGEV